MLRAKVLSITWKGAIVFLPIETYLTFREGAFPISEYAANIIGVCIALWGVASARRGKPYADGLLAAGWAWTTAVAWRATNLRYWVASEGEPLDFGSLELWLGPVLTMLAAAVLAGSLVLLVKGQPHVTERSPERT